MFLTLLYMQLLQQGCSSPDHLMLGAMIVLNIRPNENIYNINRLTKRPSSSCHDDVAFAS